MKRLLSGLSVVLALAVLGTAAPKDSGTLVDSGTFDVLVDGKRVATENFKIQQNAGGSVTTSTIKVLAGTKTEQSSVLELTPTGNLVRYSWKELSPGKAQTTVEVTSGSVLQRVMLPDQRKPLDVPYLIPATTAVLESNFYSHQELLVWRFLGASCRTAADGTAACAPTNLGILVPGQQLTTTVKLELVGIEKVAWKGVDRDMLHLKLTSDEIAWDIWVDPADSYKVMRIVIPANKTEVVRA